VSVSRAFVLSCFIKIVTEALVEKRVEKRCYMRKEVCEKGSGGRGGPLRGQITRSTPNFKYYA